MGFQVLTDCVGPDAHDDGVEFRKVPAGEILG